MTRARRTKPPAAPPSAPPDAMQRLIHELEVHQVELELQNEELRNVRSELETGLARYTELFDFAPIGYAITDAESNIQQINHAGARLLGRARAQLTRARLAAFVEIRDLPTFRELLKAASDEHADHSRDVRIRTVDDEPRWLRVTATELPRGDGRVLLAFDDITQRKAEAERLASAEHALREASKRKDEFLAMLSHELRNPLAPIKSSLFVLSRAEPGTEYARNAQEIIDRQITHLTRLIDELLDMTRITRGKITLRRERVELQELVRRAVEDHAQALESDHLRVQVRTGSEPLWIDADPVRIVQVISNLLGNASKFTAAGGTVIVTVSRIIDQACVTVADNGLGIPPDVVPYLFEPFAQAPQSSDRSRGGLGLGLAMVKGIIELHGGRVSLASEGTGRGTTVRFTIPLAT